MDSGNEILSVWVTVGVVVCAIIVLIVAIRWIIRKVRQPELLGMSKEDIHKTWQEIELLVSQNSEMSYKLAVLEADKLLDHALKSMGFGGNTLGERLKLACYRFPRLKRVWQAHLLRNKLVHEASFHLSRGAARGAIGQFRDALKELSVL